MCRCVKLSDLLNTQSFQVMFSSFDFLLNFWGGGGGVGEGVGANSKKVHTHPKIPEIDFFRLLLTFNKIIQTLS